MQQNKILYFQHRSLRLGLDSNANALLCTPTFFSMGLIYCSQDPQVQNLANITLKLGLTTLFTHLKIILLQYFQFSTTNSIQTDPYLFSFFWKRHMKIELHISTTHPVSWKHYVFTPHLCSLFYQFDCKMYCYRKVSWIDLKHDWRQVTFLSYLVVPLRFGNKWFHAHDACFTTSYKASHITQLQFP